VLPDLLGEIRPDLRDLLFVRAEDEGGGERLLVLLFREVLRLVEAAKNVIAPADSGLRIEDRAVEHRTADQAGDRGRFRRRELPGVFSEVQTGRGLDSVRAVTEVDLVRVELEDLILGEILFDVDGQEGLVHLSPPALLRREKDLLRQLL